MKPILTLFTIDTKITVMRVSGPQNCHAWGPGVSKSLSSGQIGRVLEVQYVIYVVNSYLGIDGSLYSKTVKYGGSPWP